MGQVGKCKLEMDFETVTVTQLPPSVLLHSWELPFFGPIMDGLAAWPRKTMKSICTKDRWENTSKLSSNRHPLGGDG